MNHSRNLIFYINNQEKINNLSCRIFTIDTNTAEFIDNQKIDPVCVNETYLFHLSSFQLKCLLESLHKNLVYEPSFQICLDETNTQHENNDYTLINGIQFDIFRLGSFNPNFILSVNQYSIQFFCLLLKNMHSVNLIISTALYSKLKRNKQNMYLLDDLVSELISFKGDAFGICGKIVRISKFNNIMVLVSYILKLRQVEITYNKDYDSYKNLNLVVLHESFKVPQNFSDSAILESLREYEKNDCLIKERSINQQDVKQYFEILELKSNEVSYLIGKKGYKIKRLKENTSCDIKIMSQKPDDENSMVTGSDKIDIQYVRIVSNEQRNVDYCLKVIKNELSLFEVKNQTLRLHRIRMQSLGLENNQKGCSVESQMLEN